ncbi:MAG TPA: hypothetical protein VKM55_05035 [Candidatus Lokiarchaeia archaeon]|nr:hypothetical protein [Candidatus Lokiarchaeia archaeon]
MHLSFEFLHFCRKLRVIITWVINCDVKEYRPFLTRDAPERRVYSPEFARMLTFF